MFQVVDGWHKGFITKIDNSWLEELYVFLVLFCWVVTVSLALGLFQHWRKLALSCDLAREYIWADNIVFLFAWTLLVFGFLRWKLVSWKLVSDQVEVSLLRSLNLGDDLNVLVNGLFFLIFGPLFQFPECNFLKNCRIEKFLSWGSRLGIDLEAKCNEII